ncbi:MAG: putative bifunctional diguanylate cyclase/phosphodiesterase [Sulfuriferula sp.]
MLANCDKFATLKLAWQDYPATKTACTQTMNTKADLSVSMDALLQTQWRLATNRKLDQSQKIAAMLKSATLYLAAHHAWIIEIDTRQDAIVHYKFEPDNAIFSMENQPEFQAICAQLKLDPDAPWVIGSLGLAKLTISYIAAPIWLDQQQFGFVCFMTAQEFAAPTHYSPTVSNFVELLAAGFSQILLQIRQHEVLQNMALTDALTELPNRRAAEIRLQEELARVARTGEYFTVSICDLDRFKLVNDNYGHQIGDTILQHAARTLQQEMRYGDWIARWGGEEFLIYLYDTNPEQAYQIMERLRTNYQNTPFKQFNDLDLTISAGISSVQSRTIDLNRTLSNADTALYDAKNRGRNRVILHQKGQRSIFKHAGEIHTALKNNKIIAAFQPIADLATGKIVAKEALARLVNMQGRLVPATDFINAAEGLQIVQLIDETIAHQTLEYCIREQESSNKPHITHFINLSPQLLSNPERLTALLHKIERTCADYNEPGDNKEPLLVFEITERQFIHDFDQLCNQIKPLIDMGFHLALDDFGSGYSSFLYLAKLPISYLKIEGWLISNMRGNLKITEIIQAIVDLSRKQNIITIAENIEDAETAKLLLEMGVNWGQGYYFGYPECLVPELVQD